MSDDKVREDDDNPKPRPVKRPARPRVEWLVPRGIAWLDGKTEVRAKAGAKLEAGVIPADLVDEYAGRGDIIRVDGKGSI